MPGTDPPRCISHCGGPKPALKHGFYARPDLPENPTLDDRIQELFQRYERLGAYIDERQEAGTITPAEMIHLSKKFGEAASNLAKLMRARKERQERARAECLRRAYNQALDELSEELGVDL